MVVVNCSAFPRAQLCSKTRPADVSALTSVMECEGSSTSILTQHRKCISWPEVQPTSQWKPKRIPRKAEDIELTLTTTASPTWSSSRCSGQWWETTWKIVDMTIRSADKNLDGLISFDDFKENPNSFYFDRKQLFLTKNLIFYFIKWTFLETLIRLW